MTRRFLGAVADSGPVLVLAGIAAAGSFTHIRDTATEHGQHGWMAWAVAVCIDLTCVMAAGERQRDKRTGRDTGPLSWPTVVLVGGILLSLAANLAQADPSVWGWITAGTPAGAFLVAVSMLERRKSGGGAGDPAPSPVESSSPWVVWEDDRAEVADDRPRVRTPVPPVLSGDHSEDDAARDGDDTARGGEHDEDGQTSLSLPSDEKTAAEVPSRAAPLVDYARRVAAEHESTHGRPITRDALRARLGVSNQLASDLLRQLRTESPA